MSPGRPAGRRATATGRDRGWVAAAAGAVARRPALWATAGRQALALAPSGWWRRPPHLPLPAPGYLAFRMVTAYGDPGAAPPPGDVVAYLGWCREERRRCRGGSGRLRRISPLSGRAGR